MIETVWLLVEISLSTGAVTLARDVEFRSERACLSARDGNGTVGVIGALDRSAIVCRRVNREKTR